MVRSTRLLLALAALASTASATLLRGRIVTNSSLDHDAFVSIVSQSSSPLTTISTPVLHDNSFSIDLPSGDYVLRVLNRVSDFQNYAIRVGPSGEPSIHVQIFFPGPSVVPMHSTPSLPIPLQVQLLGDRIYEEPAGSFDIIKMLKTNPLLIMLAVGAAISFGLPSLLSQLDPETLKEVTDNQAQMHQKMASIQNVDFSSGLSKFLAPSATIEELEDEPGPPPALGPATGASSGRANTGGGKGRKRK